MSKEDWMQLDDDLRQVQDQDLISSVEDDILKEREKTINFYHALIAEAWKNLRPEAKRLVRIYQQMVSRPDPAIRMLFSLSEGDKQKLGQLENSHLFSSHISCCRNLPDYAVHAMQDPAFLNLERDITLCFDVTRNLRWYPAAGCNFAIASVPIQLGENAFQEIDVYLTKQESDLYASYAPANISEKRLQAELEQFQLAESDQFQLDSQTAKYSKGSSDDESLILKMQMEEWGIHNYE